MSHRNSDNSGPWNNRNSRNNNNNNDGGDGGGGGGGGRGAGGGGGGGGYKDRNWGGNNRYGADNRYNNNNKERRNYRGYGGGGRRNYDGRPYRNNAWGNNGGVQDGNYPRYQNNWHQQKHLGNNKPGLLGPEPGAMQLQIPPLMINFDVDQQQQQRVEPVSSSGADRDSAKGSSVDKETSESSNKSWMNDDFGSPGDGFQGFADVDFAKTPNGGSSSNCMDFSSKLTSEKSDISLQENELSKLIVDEAMKIISDAEQPSCSSAASQSNPSDASAPAAASTASAPNPERRASIERSAEQVTRKLINQLTSMNKHSLKQMINNPDSKYETALKTHARQKLRAEVRRQLRNFNMNESSAEPKTSCSMLEPDESVDSDKIPDALLEQIGKVLDLNLLELNETEEPVPPAPTVGGEEDESVTNPSDADYSATEVLDKNLRLTDEDGQFDTDDLFARAELLLMKGSESVRQGNSSGPSSPTDEMFPNEQIDSIVSEDNGIDPNESESEQIERMLDEPLHAAFPCFLRVSTVEELNKKVDTRPVPVEESESCTVEAAVPLLPPPELVDDSSVSNLPGDDVQAPLAPVPSEEQWTPPFEITAETDVVSLVEDSSLPAKEEPAQEEPENATDLEVIPAATVPDKSVEEPAKLESIPIASPPKASTPEPSSGGTIRAPTHPELAARKSKGRYKPNLVQHEHSKRDSSSKSSSASPSQTAYPALSSHVSSLSNSKAASKSSSATNLNSVSKQEKNQNNNNNNNNNPTSNNNNSSSSVTRGRSRARRETTSSYGSKDSTGPANGTSTSGENHSKNSNNGSLSIVAAKPPAAAAPIPGNDSRPPTQPPPVEQPVVQRSVRSKTPGPALAGGPQDHSSPLGVKKKKKKRNRRKDRSPPPDSGMMLECDLRISRPAVTPTPPPVQTRDTPQIKKSTEPDRSSSSTKPSREMRAKSADPKLYYESKKDRDRYKDRGRNRDEDKKSKSKEDKKDQERDHQDRKEREARREKEGETTANGSATSLVAAEVSKTELSVSKQDHRSERKKSPVPRPAAAAAAAAAAKLPVDTPKHSKESRDAEPKEIPRETVKEREKEASKEMVKESTKEATKEPKDKEVPTKDKEVNDDSECKQEPDGLVDLPKEKDSTDVPDGPSKPAKPHKKKKSLLRGPNLIKGRREVVVVEQTEVQIQSQQKDNGEVEMVEITPPPSESNEPVASPSHSHTRQREVPAVALTQSCPTVPVPVEHHHSLMASSVASSLIQRTASPRPWKSPGEKKLIPPSITALITHPMSPPPVDRARKTPTPTPPPPVMSPEPPQRVHLVASPILMSQPEVLTGRMPLQSTLAPLAMATAVPPMNTFAPVMALLNQMQDIDNRMSDFQRRKMQIDSEMMRLNSEKFQIDQSSMQLQNERFMLLNSLRAALVECELTTLASMQSISHMPAAVAAHSPAVSHRRRNPDPEPETAPKSKRRKEALEAASRSPVVTAVVSSTELSEPEEPVTPPSSAAAGGERTIRRITKISGNTEILKLFQRRRLISDRSAEESQSEDNGAPQVASTRTMAAAAVATPNPERPTPAKRRRTRTYGGSVGAGGNDQSEPSSAGTRLRSDSTKSIEIIDHPSAAPTGPAAAGTSSRFKKDEEIPLVVAHRRVLPREVKVVLSKLNVASGRGGDGT